MDIAKKLGIGLVVFIATVILAYPWIEKLKPKPLPEPVAKAPEPEIVIPAPVDEGPDYAKSLLGLDVINAALIKDEDRDEMQELLDRAYQHYQIKNTRKELYEAVIRVYQAKEYWPDLTTRRCLQYLIDAIPDPKIVARRTMSTGSTQYRDTTTQQGHDITFDEAVISMDVEIDVSNCRIVADQIYQNLIYLSQKPLLDAAEAARIQQEETQAQIDANFAAQQEKRAAQSAQYRANQAAAADAAAVREQNRARWNQQQAYDQTIRGQRR